MMYSLFNWGGVIGNITFSHAVRGGRNVTIIEALLESQQPGDYTWAIHEWPAKYDGMDRCAGNAVGKM